MITRRHLIRSATFGGASLAIGGCNIADALRDRDNAFRDFMERAQYLTMRSQRALMGPDALAKEFPESAIRQGQKPNGSVQPRSIDYLRASANGFSGYRLAVGGLVDRPLSLSLADLRGMATRTQITRHDCVEGWSTIAQWTGTPLSAVLDRAGVAETARYVLFRCYDDLGGNGQFYYETIDMVDARHPQTILAWGLNGSALPVPNGAPLRVRVERQLGYKMAKYIRAIELVEDFSGIRGGHGGFWEDRGYAWYAGI